MKRQPVPSSPVVLFLCFSFACRTYAEPTFMIEAEAGPSWQAGNDVQIPNDASGDRFDLRKVSGSGPWPAFRLNGIWNINERHGMRVVIAPLGYEEAGTFSTDVRFAGASFEGDTPLEATYRFNSWRVGYRYRYLHRDALKLWIGATAKVRDAEITLRQGNVRSTDDDVGFVPLLHLAGEYGLGEKWHIAFDFDGLAGGPGRAFDVSLKLGYAVSDRLRLTVGYRGLEGGVDTDDVYNFAWFNTALASVQFAF